MTGSSSCSRSATADARGALVHAAEPCWSSARRPCNSCSGVGGQPRM
jgi:hypothetical protein